MTRAPLTMVVLAAGLGSRYGGLKQLEAVGPGGATLMDYSVFDAARAGFTDVVFVIRPDMEEAFRPWVAGRYGARLGVSLAHQRMDDLPAGFTMPSGRTKPWGTAHALVSAESVVHGPFVVVNADDFYGEQAYGAVADFLQKGPASTRLNEWAVVGYALRDTVSPSGGVNRAVCVTAGERLASLEEVLDITRDKPGGYRGTSAAGSRTFTGDELVSMNMWALTPAIFAMLRQSLGRFFASSAAAGGELQIPDTIESIIRSGAAAVRVLRPGSRWFGMTYRSDLPAVKVALGEMTAAGRYPGKLW